MNISAVINTVNGILSRSTFYVVPRNQRKYVWNNNQLNELYEDIFYNDSENNHFIGCLVIEKRDKDEDIFYKIIDGQQRLTTLSILILVISKLFYEYGDIKKCNSNKKFVIGDIDGENNYKILVDDSYLDSIIDSSFNSDSIEDAIACSGIKHDKYNKGLLNAYTLFYNRISTELSSYDLDDKIKKLVVLKKKLINVSLVEIKIPYDETDTMGYDIFEVLNARGVPLEQHELIKNYIFKYKKAKKGTKTDQAKKQWNTIIGSLSNESDDDIKEFFFHYVIHKYGKKYNQKEIFSAIKDNCPKNNVGELLNDLVKKSKYYSEIIDVDKYKKSKLYNEAVYNSLKFFNSFRVRQVRPLILSLFGVYDRRLISEDVFKDTINYLEKFYFIYAVVCKNRTNIIESTIHNYAYDIEKNFDAKKVSSLISSLKKFKPNFDTFDANFKEIGYSKKNNKYKNSSNKQCVVYVLEKLEKYYDEDGDYTLNNFSIEHIMCDSQDNDTTSKIGNLLPLSITRNGNISDDDFKDKVSSYEKSNLISVRKFLDNNKTKTEWTNKDIDKRTSLISKLGYEKIWNLE